MSAPDAIIAVVCRDASHPDKNWTVARLGRFAEADTEGVVAPRWASDDQLKGRVMSEVWIGNRSGDPIYDQDQSRVQVFDPPLRSSRLGSSHVYVRYTFRCTLCGMSVVAKSERVRPLLDRLAAERIDLVDLAQLRAIV